MSEISNGEVGRLLSCSALLAAETTLKALSEQMASECQAGMGNWERSWMQKHSDERAALIKVRNLLIARAEAANVPALAQSGGEKTPTKEKTNE